ncbi:MAG: TIGR00730 family Rossman fold protein [Pseudomonadota bacterium]
MKICVFCGSSAGASDIYLNAAKALGREMASRGIGLVYGGASVGLMGAVANAVLDQRGDVIGVIPEALADLEIAYEGLTELRIVDSMHSRKKQMADLADAFIALPGGIGTLEETFEVLTWSQLGFHTKPVGLLNAGGFYDQLEQFLDHVVDKGFLKPIHRAILSSDTEPGRLIDKLAAAELPSDKKWVDELKR